MVTVAERERPISVEQLESPWSRIRGGQKAFVKLSRLAPTLPPDSPLNGRIQEFIKQGSRTSMIRYALPIGRGDVDLRENDTIESLLVAIQEGQKVFTAMVEQWLPLVRKIARKIVNRLDMHNNSILEFNDLIAAGVEGLMEVVARYDPARGVPFASRAHPSIHGRIIDELRQHSGIPRGALPFRRRIEEIYDLSEVTSGKTPTIEELCIATGLTEEQVNAGLFYLKMSVISLNRPFPTDDGEEDPISERLQREDQEGVAELAVRRWEYSLLANALSQLKPREREVIIRYYFRGLTFGEIGNELGVAGSRVSQLHSAAIQHTRAFLLPLGVRDYDPAVDFVKARGYNGRLRERQQPSREKGCAPTIGAREKQIPDWVFQARDSKDPLFCFGRQITLHGEGYLTSLVRILGHTSEERQISRATLRQAVYPDLTDSEYAELRLSADLTKARQQFGKLGLVIVNPVSHRERAQGIEARHFIKDGNSNSAPVVFEAEQERETLKTN